MSVLTIFDKSQEGRKGIGLPKLDVPKIEILNEFKREQKAQLPELSEFDVVRHFTNLSSKNFAIDKNFYPLGSCTMKYNPKIAEKVAGLDGFLSLHPHLVTNQMGEEVQGALEVVDLLEQKLCAITGMNAFTTTPQAGAHGEMLGIMMIHKYHESRNDKRKYVIVPDSSHGTNPATAAMVGYEVITIKSDENGAMDFEEFKAKMSDEVAAVMLTVPNTLGIYNKKIKEICTLAHEYGAMMYYDGANMNAIMGVARPGDIGFDVMHINVHKTFATPHGGGGPGSGPVGVNEKLKPFLPDLGVKKVDGKYEFTNGGSNSIGKISPFFGNYGISLRALVYMTVLGGNGMKNASSKAVLNANYIRVKLKNYFDMPFDTMCMHECVLSAKTLAKEHKVTAMDIAKYLLDFGMHAPTVYFPLIVKEAIMIEPTETENKQTIDEFCQKMIDAVELAKQNSEAFKEYPKTLGVSRPDDTRAIKELDVCYAF
ncbi:glycine dehydrogenase (aminomethyl-transferring) [Halarcobacter ebronensis]|uniref:glycine dehydrogenase (aminomethyl-transferring) n=1 Tax=Halarcobacter ebronensis TaxID=1462615 RepID=A0A4Q0YED3_9BACT|nr:aminomethyl-transferring glycine dehydrogenase subunit GcvPB [Halarcobacter ebronensis]RXJ68445.1 glycine dehydrogenase (aminomethyl-transferring) [Halarcobacter ebronensis]